MNNINGNDESLFYCDIEINEKTSHFVSALKEISVQEAKQIYILNKPLGTSKEYTYDLPDVAIILMPEHQVTILSYGNYDEDELEEFLWDLKEDLGFLSDKYDYKSILGRTRKWPEDLFSICKIDEFDALSFVNNKIAVLHRRKIELLISLLIGSINSVDKIGIDTPETLLDKVKQKIILFDGQQSRFIYHNREQKVVRIQGMAGTGKTELLLHKLKDVYSSERDSVIAFTCFNKVLANNMRDRIPQFFNFMRVEEQIDWERRLFVFSSWGSAKEPFSGMYRYICYKYKVPFYNYKNNPNFNSLCHQVLDELNERESFEPCFDYIFIDESQDFKDGFFKLCEKVTRKCVYIAGDIFQNIYDKSTHTKIKPDFLLNKCYRTDPKTLMFAHAVGMGLYESPQINWLDDEGWISCGYLLERYTDSRTIGLSRKPLRRFEDLDATNTIRMSKCANNEYSREIISAINEIRLENPSVEPQDIAIIILGNYTTLCGIADNTMIMLDIEYGWSAKRGYISKYKPTDSVYISNENNVKGLEFPFVICVVPGTISKNILVRNSIYMALTRSFLTSYFIIGEANADFYDIYNNARNRIVRDGKIVVHEPTAEEREEMDSQIQITLAEKKKIFAEIMDELFDEEYAYLDTEQRKFVSDTMVKIASKLPEDQVKQRARTFIETVMGANNS